MIEKKLDNKFLCYYQTNQKNGDPYFFVSRKRNVEDLAINSKEIKSDAVTIIPFYENGDIVFIKQFRPAIGRYIYELPAGLIDPNENPEESVKRELKEETNLDAKEISLLLSPRFLSCGLTDESSSIYKVLVSEDSDLSSKNQQVDEGEDIVSVIRIKKEDLADFVMNNEVAMIASLIALGWNSL